MKLKFEKHPHYTGGSSGKLNKIHLDLGFTKFVSRIIPKRNMEGWMVDENKIKIINQHTNGVVGEHWVGDRNPKDEFTLHNSFLTKSGKYIGDIETAWWYYKNNFVVCEDYPGGVAEKFIFDDSFRRVIVGYYGYTHRGGNLFQIGDRLFDESYNPIEGDYEEWEWAGYLDKYESRLNSADDFDRTWLTDSGIACVIPYRMRGRKVIETLEEAKVAAINMSKSLS